MIRKFLDLSTAHLSPATRVWLDQQGVVAAARRTAADPDCMILMGSTPHGWFCYADTEACSDPAAYMRLLNGMKNSISDRPAGDGAAPGAINDLEHLIAALVTEPSADIPADLWNCFARANAEECDYILFDADGPELDFLPIFNDSAEIIDLRPMLAGASR